MTPSDAPKVNIENLRVAEKTFLAMSALCLVGLLINTIAEPTSTAGEIGFVVVSNLALLAMAVAFYWPARKARRMITADLDRRRATGSE